MQLPQLSEKPIAVRTIELTQPLQPILDLENYESVQVFPTWQNIPIGCFQVHHNFQPTVEVAVLETEIAQLAWQPPTLLPPLDQQISVSIVICTCDRPEVLRRCLQTLSAQVNTRTVEILIVDNRPDSGITAPVVAEFPQVKYLKEPRAGVAYARNTGFLASSGEIIVTTDDDVVITPQWLEYLIAPFRRSEVMAVTGNILPLELETTSQQIFEVYGSGGLGRGFQSFEVDRAWFDRAWPAVETWELGTTANSAFRATIFQNPEIGLMYEALGGGTPAGAGADIYLLYRILKAGGVLVYNPSACVWHQHRRQLSALKQQIYAYSKSLTAYSLITLLRDYDLRVLAWLVLFPLYHLKQLLVWLFVDRRYPVDLIGLEIWGYLGGGWALWRSYRRMCQLGRSYSQS